ncbi:MAG: ROK family protein [Phycisphaerae bacterium]|jgi:glucokinase
MGASGHAVGVDLGGQSVRLAVVSAAGAIQLKRQSAIDAARPAGELADLILAQIRDLLAQAAAAGLAVGGVGLVMPGYMDAGRTRLLSAANLPTLGGTDFLERIRNGLNLPVVFDADCNAAAVGEYHFGAGRGAERLIVVTVGTGIGAGVLIDGQVLRIFNHVGGSLGHVIVDATGPRCACGGRGCVEARASGRALERLAGELADRDPASRLARLRAQYGRLTGVEIGQALGEADPAAGEAVRQVGWWLGAGIASWSAIYAPQRVLIGGGIIGLGEPYLAAIRAGLREVGQPYLTADLDVLPAALGPDAGLIGAGAIALRIARDERV